MSLEIVKNQIINFLQSDTPEVMVIRGKWGIGKTYYWDQILFEYREKIVGIDSYSYVSLFGLKKISDIKNAVIENTIDKKIIGEKPNIETIISNFNSYSKMYGKKFGKFFAKFIPKAWLTSRLEISDFSFILNQNKLICFDDIERLGNGVDANQLLGLISDLRLQKNCKIILILNDEKLKDNAEAYAELKEKIIDKEVLFEPTPEECANIVFGSDKISLILKELTKTLEIVNIRILLKIKNSTNQLYKYLSNYNEEIIYSALHSLVLFCYCKYEKDKSIPTLDQLKNVDYSMLIAGEDSSDENFLPWITILRKYNYFNTQEFDRIIMNAVSKGYFDEESLIREANKLALDVNKNNALNSFREVWSLYYDSFDDNEEEFVKNLYQVFCNNIDYLFVDALNSTIITLRALGKDDLADDLIEKFADNKSNTPEYCNTENLKAFNKSEIDEKMKLKLDSIFKKSIPTKTIEDILINYYQNLVITQDDKKILNEADKEYFYNIFKKNESSKLKKVIKSSLSLKIKSAIEALKVISDESKFNKLRVKKIYGISFEYEEKRDY